MTIECQRLSCPICRSGRITHFSSSIFISVAYHYYCCGECGSLFLLPKPSLDHLHRFYNEKYYDNCKDGCLLTTKQNTYFELANEISRSLVSGGDVLEIGAGTGFFMKMLEEHGLTVWGTEISIASRKLNPYSMHGKLFSSLGEIPDSLKFHAVIYNDVLEHLLNPEEELAGLARHLYGDALIFIVTPDRSSLSAKLFGKNWAHLSIPEHIHLFSRKGFTCFASRLPFSILRIQSLQKNLSLFYMHHILDRYSKIKVDAWLLKMLLRILPRAVCEKAIKIPTGHMHIVMKYRLPEVPG